MQSIMSSFETELDLSKWIDLVRKLWFYVKCDNHFGVDTRFLLLFNEEVEHNLSKRLQILLGEEAAHVIYDPTSKKFQPVQLQEENLKAEYTRIMVNLVESMSKEIDFLATDCLTMIQSDYKFLYEEINMSNYSLQKISTIEKAKIFPDRFSMNNILSNSKEDTCVPAAIAALSQYPGLLKRLVESKCACDQVWISCAGLWKLITCDDLLLLEKDKTRNIPFGAHSKNGEFYPSIIEKALAIYFKGYKNLKYLLPYEVLSCLSGAPISIFSLKRVKDQSLEESIAKYIKDHIEKKFPILVQLSISENNTALKKTCSIIGIDVDNQTIKLRDPSMYKFKEAVYDDEGNFTLSIAHFSQIFSNLTSALLENKYFSQTISLKNRAEPFIDSSTGKEILLFELEIKTPTTLQIMLTHEFRRFRSEKQEFWHKYPFTRIIFTEYDKNGKLKKTKPKEKGSFQAHQHRDLQPGKYLVLIEVLRQKDEIGNFNFTTYSSKRIILKQRNSGDFKYDRNLNHIAHIDEACKTEALYLKIYEELFESILTQENAQVKMEYSDSFKDFKIMSVNYLDLKGLKLINLHPNLTLYVKISIETSQNDCSILYPKRSRDCLSFDRVFQLGYKQESIIIFTIKDRSKMDNIKIEKTLKLCTNYPCLDLTPIKLKEEALVKGKKDLIEDGKVILYKLKGNYQGLQCIVFHNAFASKFKVTFDLTGTGYGLLKESEIIPQSSLDFTLEKGEKSLVAILTTDPWNKKFEGTLYLEIDDMKKKINYELIK